MIGLRLWRLVVRVKMKGAVRRRLNAQFQIDIVRQSLCISVTNNITFVEHDTAFYIGGWKKIPL
jgi:hypothetical protein